MPKTIAVIDGNSLMHRAYHAVPPTMNAADGTPTHAVFGFLSMLLKFIDVASPDAIVCAFDAGKPAFRIEAMEEYKAQRPPMDDDLRVQFPLIEDLLESMDIPVVKVPGWEGDDILGTVAARAEALGCDVLLVTGDKDACQLASEHTRIFTTKKGISDVVVFDPAMVEEKYGVAPAQIPDFLGLMGDSSDNIPGVPGIGQKTAAKLLQRFGSMEGIYQNLDQLKGKQLENLQNNRDVAFLSRDVATIVRDLDFPLELESLSFPSYQAEAVSEAFGKLGMNLHLSKVLSLIGGSATASSAQARFEEIEPLEGDDALEAIGQMMEAAEEEHPLGLAVRKPSQESLFGVAISLALSDGDRVALVDGDCALETLKRLVVGQVPFAVLDAKAAFQVLYPADASLEAHITADQMDDARVFDIQLAAYVLDSSVSDYSLQMLMERELGCVPDCADREQPGIAIEAQAAFELFGPLVDKLEADGTTDVYRDIDLPLVSVLVQMERTGAALDAECLERIGAETAADLD
ncbi:MAG: 5'-3' exonuclease H3TH domain-containing protein, partial [Eggerthellaceae bacterium]|nr:5'-3' exonuclease H3TH domain-containing protein [Eggerthellaceae bacterium]